MALEWGVRTEYYIENGKGHSSAVSAYKYFGAVVGHFYAIVHGVVETGCDYRRCGHQIGGKTQTGRRAKCTEQDKQMQEVLLRPGA